MITNETYLGLKTEMLVQKIRGLLSLAILIL